MNDVQASKPTLGALPDPIPDPLVELLAGRLRVIGEPTRIRLLDRLRHGPRAFRSWSRQPAAANSTSPSI